MYLPTEYCAVLSNPAGGRVIFTDRSENSTANYICNNTHIIFGDASRVCGADGEWSGQEPVCCEFSYSLQWNLLQWSPMGHEFVAVIERWLFNRRAKLIHATLSQVT